MFKHSAHITNNFMGQFVNAVLLSCGFLILLAAGLLLAFNIIRYDWDQPPRTSDERYTGRIAAELSMTRPSFNNIARYSDLVVLGEITEKSDETTSWPVRLLETMTLNVLDTYKGNSPSSLIVKERKPISGGVMYSGDEHRERMVFSVGQKYVLFLIEREGHYVVQGYSRGMWSVDGDTATLAETGETIPLYRLRERVSDFR